MKKFEWNKNAETKKGTLLIFGDYIDFEPTHAYVSLMGALDGLSTFNAVIEKGYIWEFPKNITLADVQRVMRKYIPKLLENE